MRIAFAVFLTITGFCVGVLVWLVLAFHTNHVFGPDRRTTFFINGFDSSRLYSLTALVATVAAFVAVVLALILAGRITKTAYRRTVRIALSAVVVVGVPVAGFNLLGTAIDAGAAYTEIDGPTLDRDLVIREWSLLFAGGGDVFEREGSMLTLIGKTGADDGATPFARGEYTATEVDGTVTLEWPFTDTSLGRLVIGPAGVIPPTHDGLYRYETMSTP